MIVVQLCYFNLIWFFKNLKIINLSDFKIDLFSFINFKFFDLILLFTINLLDFKVNLFSFINLNFYAHIIFFTLQLVIRIHLVFKVNVLLIYLSKKTLLNFRFILKLNFFPFLF